MQNLLIGLVVLLLLLVLVALALLWRLLNRDGAARDLVPQLENTLVPKLEGSLVPKLQGSLVPALEGRLNGNHREVLKDLQDGLARQTDTSHAANERLAGHLGEALTRSGEALRKSMLDTLEALRGVVGTELTATREAQAILEKSLGEAFGQFKLSQTEQLSESRQAIDLRLVTFTQMLSETLNQFKLAQAEQLNSGREATEKRLNEIALSLQQKQDQLREDVLVRLSSILSEQSKRSMEQMDLSLANTTSRLTTAVGELTKTADTKLGEISGKVTERLDEGFKKTNETFASVMARLATIDEAQKKIDGLTTNVVSLQELLGDKRSRGAFGEVQLEHLVRNVLPTGTYEFQAVLSNQKRADCILYLPAPTGVTAVDSKFPLENYHRMFEPGYDKTVATRDFKGDIKKHVDDISSKYIIPGETSDGAVMFIPAEAVFAEVHAYHADMIDYAQKKRVWIVSPTTLMAVLNTARAVLRDVETREQVHIIQKSLGKLGEEFGRFDDRMKKLATHIRQAHEDVDNVAVTSGKISKRFREIESVRLEAVSDGVDGEAVEQVLAMADGIEDGA